MSPVGLAVKAALLAYKAKQKLLTLQLIPSGNASDGDSMYSRQAGEAL